MRTSVIEQSPDFARWLRDISVIDSEISDDLDTMTKESRWYIAGKYCEMEKRNRKRSESICSLYRRISQDMGCTEPMIRRFVSYYIAIESLRAVAPDVVSDILTGVLKLSVENVRSLVKQSSIEIQITVERVKSGKERIYEIFPARIVKQSEAILGGQRQSATVKDTPQYDPDAPVAGLTYTIPSWVNAIDRVFMSDTIHAVSKPASKKLTKELILLKKATKSLLELVLEEDCEERV